MQSVSITLWLGLGMENPSLRRVHKTLIAPVMNYATAGWQPWLSKSKMDELERAQNRALRTITGQTRTAPTEALQAEAGMESYRTTSRLLCAVACQKPKRMPADHPRRIALEGSARHRLHRSSWRKHRSRL